MENVYCALCTESLSRTDTFRLYRVKENKTIRECGTHDGETINANRILVGISILFWEFLG